MILADPASDEASIWQLVESCGYRADLDTWLALTAGTRTVLDLGCGIGRVARPLAAAGREVTGVDRDPQMIADLNRLANEPGLRGLIGDATELADLELGAARFGAVLAPQQFLHVIGDAAARHRVLVGVRRRLEPEGLAAFAISEWSPEESRPVEVLPDVREVGDWVYASRPVAVEHQRDALTVLRLRQVVSPDGKLKESHDAITLARLDRETLATELAAAGLRVTDTIDIPETDRHVASVIVVARHGAGGPAPVGLPR